MGRKPEVGTRDPETGKVHGTVMGFDYGHKRIGAAVGETVTGSARGLKALHATADGTPPWSAIAALLDEWRPVPGWGDPQPRILVVGLPRHLDGRDAPLAASARDFAGELARRSGLSVALCDEALSTEAARDRLAERRAAGARRATRDDLNAEAACQILQTWLAENA